MASPPVVLCFSGHDATGGAGISADIQAINSQGCHACTVVTCLTVQDSIDVSGLIPVAEDIVIQSARAVLEDEVLAQLTRTRLIRFKPAPTGEARVALNTNRLLGRYPGVVGMKTGYTGEAGRVLVSAIETDGHTLVAVVMGSENHFADTATLFDYITARLSVRDRFLLPLVEQEGGGALTAPGMADAEQRFLKIIEPLPSGTEATTPWGETPGTRAIEEMIRNMLPSTLGGTD